MTVHPHIFLSQAWEIFFKERCKFRNRYGIIVTLRHPLHRNDEWFSICSDEIEIRGFTKKGKVWSRPLDNKKQLTRYIGGLKRRKR